VPDEGRDTPLFLEIGSFYNSLGFHSADFLILRRISVTRQFLVPLTSIVGKIWKLMQKMAGY